MGYKIVAVNPLKPFPLPSFGLANVASLDDANSQLRTLTAVLKFEARWAEGKIEPALKLHLARQERRLAHFNASCRFVGCDNPRRQKRGGGTGTKARRPAVRPLFCGAHVGLRKLLTQSALDELHTSSTKRVAISR